MTPPNRASRDSFDWAKSVQHAIDFVAPAKTKKGPSTGNLEWRERHLSGFRHSVPPEPYGISPRLTVFSGGVAYWIEDIASVEHARLEIVLRAHFFQQSLQDLNPSDDLLEEVQHAGSVFWSANFEAASRSVARWKNDVKILERLVSSNDLSSRRTDGKAFVSAEIEMNRGIQNAWVRRSENSHVGPHERAYSAQQAVLYGELCDSLEALHERLSRLTL